MAGADSSDEDMAPAPAPRRRAPPKRKAGGAEDDGGRGRRRRARDGGRKYGDQARRTARNCPVDAGAGRAHGRARARGRFAPPRIAARESSPPQRCGRDRGSSGVGRGRETCGSSAAAPRQATRIVRGRPRRSDEVGDAGGRAIRPRTLVSRQHAVDAGRGDAAAATWIFCGAGGGAAVRPRTGSGDAGRRGDAASNTGRAGSSGAGRRRDARARPGARKRGQPRPGG